MTIKEAVFIPVELLKRVGVWLLQNLVIPVAIAISEKIIDKIIKKKAKKPVVK